jgi:hypothetical protein
MRSCNSCQTGAELTQPGSVVTRQTQRQREAHGPSTHGSQITQIHKQSTLSQQKRI